MYSFIGVQLNDIFIRTDAIRVYIGTFTYYFIMNGRKLRYKIQIPISILIGANDSNKVHINTI